MPLFGKLFAKSLQEYNWLQESAQNFPDKKKLAQMFAEVGYERIKVKTFTGGVSAMHLAYKPK
ncbi:menaquinone biosynthesis methyltransferase UbiE [Staphylococcus aureus]|nr:menaquinone biosynthesis methyltransferase UbiE [Staphylococcus aureus]